MSLVHNEQTKLTAGALDRVSTACVAIGVIAPAAAWTFAAPGHPMGLALLGFSLGWFALAAGLHLFARVLLRSLSA